MVYYSFAFLIVAVIAAIVGMNTAATAANIAWVLVIVGLVLALVFWQNERSRR